MKNQAKVEKPPYRVPLMSEIREVRSNGLNVVSTFSGCGGSCLGFKMAGYNHLMASEFVPAAREVYELNFPGVPVLPGDIRDVTVDQVLDVIRMRPGELDVLEGSPPCANFSTAGKRQKSWGKKKKYSETEQVADDLFFEFARFLDGLKPRAFVAENVSGLVKGVAKGYFKLILARLKVCGYRVECRILDAQWLGVPQARQRTIFVGVREDLGIDPVHPAPLPYRYVIRDAIPWVDGSVAGVVVPKDDCVEGRVTKRSGYRGCENSVNLRMPAPTVMALGMGGVGSHQIGIKAPLPDESIEGTAIHKEWEHLRPGQSSNKYFNLVRPDLDRPLPTVTQAGGRRCVASVTHPTEPRKFTIFELKRLCGFPDDFELRGRYAQQWERLGRAVPPPMMYHVAKALESVLLPKRDATTCAG